MMIPLYTPLICPNFDIFFFGGACDSALFWTDFDFFTVAMIFDFKDHKDNAISCAIIHLMKKMLQQSETVVTRAIHRAYNVISFFLLQQRIDKVACALPSQNGTENNFL